MIYDNKKLYNYVNNENKNITNITKVIKSYIFVFFCYNYYESS